MVHVRKVNGETEVFGNQGALFQRAMTWWDHSTFSVWSQVWGRAIDGPLKGTELELIPSQTVPWGTWKAQHPGTLVMTNDVARLPFARERFRSDYLIGITLGEHAKAYPYDVAARERVVNDAVGPHPVVVIADPETRAVFVYLRTRDDRTLTFRPHDGDIVDVETGTVWDPVNGLAVDGPHRGEALKPVPYIPVFDGSWQGFYPHSETYTGS